MKKEALLAEFNSNLHKLQPTLLQEQLSAEDWEIMQHQTELYAFDDRGVESKSQSEINHEAVAMSFANAKDLFAAALTEGLEHDYSGAQLLMQLMAFRKAIDSANSAKKMTGKVAAASKEAFARALCSLYQAEKKPVENAQGGAQLTKKGLREKLARELVIGLSGKNIITMPSVPNCLQAFDDAFKTFEENVLMSAADVKSQLANFGNNINDRVALGFEHPNGISGSPAAASKNILIAHVQELLKASTAAVSLGLPAAQEIKQAAEPVQSAPKKDEALEKFTAFKAELDKLKPGLLAEQKRPQDTKTVNDSFENAYKQFQALLKGKPENVDISSYMNSQVSTFNATIDSENAARRMTGRVAGAAKNAFSGVLTTNVVLDADKGSSRPRPQS